MPDLKNRKWNSKHTQLAMKFLQNDVKRHSVNVNLEHPYLDGLSHQTKSPRILRMIEEAYYLGMARGILSVDEGMTPVVLREQLLSDIGMTEECLGCKSCEITENGSNGFLGDTVLNCKICEEGNENKETCFDKKED